MLSDPTVTLERDELHWLAFPIAAHHFNNPNRKPGGAMIKGDWKLIELMETPQGLVHHFELYNLRDDPEEQQDVSSENPELVAELKRAMTKWRTEVDAPQYDASMYKK